MTMTEINNRRQQSLLGGGEARIAAQHQKVRHQLAIPVPISEFSGEIDSKRTFGATTGQRDF